MADFPIKKDEIINGGVNSYIYPQHEKADGSFAITGEKNPLPVAGYGMTSGGVWIPQRVSDDGAAHTQLTGSNIEHIQLVEAQEIRGSENEVTKFEYFDISSIKSYEVYTRSSLDVAIALVLYTGVHGTVELDSGEIMSYELVGGGYSRQHVIVPNSEFGENRHRFIPLYQYDLGQQIKDDIYKPADVDFYKNLPIGSGLRCRVEIRLVHGVPSEGSFEAVMKGVK